MGYRETTPLETRRNDQRRVAEAYPARVACIVEPLGEAEPPIDKIKFVVPRDLLASHLRVVVRRRVHLDASSALFLLLDGGTLPAMTETVGALHRKHADAEDGFLYLKFARENAFGAWGSAR